MQKVDFNRDSFNKCLCGACPVQRDSKCVAGKEAEFAPLKEAIQRDGRMPEPPRIVPGVYCSAEVGRSECTDLDGDKACLCPACPVFFNTGLTGNYYCMQAQADREKV